MKQMQLPFRQVNMKKVMKNLIKYTGVLILILSLVLTNSLSNLLSGVGLQQLAQEVKIKEAYAFSETFTATTTWTAPTGVTSVEVEVWGGGGGGGGQNLSSDGGGGGGGGAYSKKLSIATVPATGYTVTVGAAGTAGSDGCGGTGGDSWFSTSGTVMAKGGVGGCNSTGTPPAGGAGGTAASGVGDTKFSGGQGEIGNNNATGRGGYGGSSAGTAADGWSGPQTYSTSTYPTANTPTGGGHGGNGGNGAGLSGQAPASGNGGGGGGSGEGTASETGGAGAVGKVIITYTQTTLATGTDPAAATVAPESGIRDAGSFTLVTDTGTSSVTALTVTLAGAGTPYDGLSEVRITSDDGATLYFAAISNPTSNTLNFSAGTPISVTTTSTQYKIRVTPKTHANMAVPPGASYDMSPYVSAFTVNSNSTGTDSNANTLTIDNLSPNGATVVSGSAGVQAVTVNWTTSNSSDFNTTSGSVIYRWASGTAGSEVPAENSTPAIGSANGTATVACVTSSAASTAQSKIDGNGGSVDCTTANLTGGQAYTYKAFQKDTNGNYDVGVLIGTFTPSSSTVVTVDETGTQSSPLIIPSTGNYIGGAFTMVRGTGTANVTSITITESGTVDALNNLNNIKLQYDLDITAPYNCASESYAAGDTQYGATDTNGFSAANGTSVFTGSVAVSDVQAMCVYVVLDVLSAASDGQTMIVRITNPSTDVVVSAGTVEPSTAQGLGTTTLEVPKITVATEGTQANMVIGIGDNNVGGAFSFTRNTSSANVTQIIITDTGTVNANANISDVRVYYKQEGTCSSSIPVDATLFNSTAGTFNASEKTTVTGTMTVGTSKICVYVRVDVGDGATDAQTLEIQIANPSTEVTVSAGSVTPSTAVAISGTTTLNLPTYTSLGMPFLYTANNWGTGGSGVSFYLEVYMRQTTGTVYARLLNETDTTAVTGSTLSTTSSTFTRVRTAALTLTDGKTYRVQFGKIGADAGKTMGGKLVVNQNGVGGGGGGGGADLAEYYSSPDQLDLAEVVSIDPAKSASVKRSDKPYQKDILGVVATQPGIILGENTGQSYPIALVGRVPVRVTLENGQIKTGDFLTSSSTPGHAIKATKAGRVLGQALESLDEKDLRDCPNGGQRTCGTVMVFVNLIDYLGAPVEMVMEEKSQDAHDDQGVKLEETQMPIASYTESIATSSASMQSDKSNEQQKILAFLKDLKESQNGTISSEVFVGRVAATDEVITPLIFTDTLYAKKIKADSIEGLEILTDKISTHQTASSSAVIVNSAAQSDSSPAIASMSAIPSGDTIVTLGNITIETAEIKLDLTVLGKLETQGGLIVGGPAEFKDNTIFNSLVQFISKVIFRGDLLFEGRPTFNKDTAGFAIIKKDADNVEVTFEKEYAATPIISVNMTFDPVKLADGNTEDSKILQKRVIESGYSYFIVNRNTRGFTIVLNKNASEDITFSWIALAVKDAQTAYSKQLQSLTATASATPIPSLIPTLSPSITPSLLESPSPPLQTLSIKENEL